VRRVLGVTNESACGCGPDTTVFARTVTEKNKAGLDLPNSGPRSLFHYRMRAAQAVALPNEQMPSMPNPSFSAFHDFGSIRTENYDIAAQFSARLDESPCFIGNEYNHPNHGDFGVFN
jgi:hypothetical protein